MSETDVSNPNAGETTRGEGEEGFPHGSKAPFVLATGIFGVFLGFIFPLEWIVGVPIFVVGFYLWFREYTLGEYESGVIPEQKRQLLGIPSAYLAAMFAIVSELLLFGGAFVAWFFLASQRGPFPNLGLPGLHPLFGLLETAALFVGSVALYWTRTGVSNGETGRLNVGIATPFVFGLIYLGLVWYDWQTLMSGGLIPTSGAYGAAYYYVSGLHFLHVIVGLIAISLLGYRFWVRKHFSQNRFTMVRIAEAYWHFLTAMSAVILLLVYLPTS